MRPSHSVCPRIKRREFKVAGADYSEETNREDQPLMVRSSQKIVQVPPVSEQRGDEPKVNVERPALMLKVS